MSPILWLCNTYLYLDLVTGLVQKVMEN